MTTLTEALTEDRLASVLAIARDQLATLQVADLAELVGYSPFHFSRMFRAHVGLGPGAYLSALRIDAAKRMLLEGSDPVIDVATAVGFESLSSFSRRFRSTVGVAPGQLRRLADRISDRPPTPFALLRPHPWGVRVHLDLPRELDRREDASVWVGWYPHPAPIGLPHSGALVSGVPHTDLPLCEGAPYLLGFAVPAHADPWDQLAPDAPLVALHPVPLIAAGEVTLHFSTEAARGGVPLLTALPSLCRS
ncbi:AraC family transcriptional regulator [Brachybacterium avium]|uniref:AraC family transcriptional regulator n=1 Tax=Brachybacterium avium TaxID=2017485 RepID=A0A220U9U2_9MICO|nr:helix-turn-helix transcriptional regulator [Brachybacterium avium]ASK65064.1 AraC family transcriptional regulator [Brachybacterium avium]